MSELCARRRENAMASKIKDWPIKYRIAIVAWLLLILAVQIGLSYLRGLSEMIALFMFGIFVMFLPKQYRMKFVLMSFLIVLFASFADPILSNLLPNIPMPTTLEQSFTTNFMIFGGFLFGLFVGWIVLLVVNQLGRLK